jgi:hypothetical protein
MSTSPYLTADEAAAELRFPSRNAFYVWRHRHPNTLPAYRRGRVLLFRKVDVELALQKEGAALATFLRKVR